MGGSFTVQSKELLKPTESIQSWCCNFELCMVTMRREHALFPPPFKMPQHTCPHYHLHLHFAHIVLSGSFLWSVWTACVSVDIGSDPGLLSVHSAWIIYHKTKIYPLSTVDFQFVGKYTSLIAGKHHPKLESAPETNGETFEWNRNLSWLLGY